MKYAISLFDWLMFASRYMSNMFSHIMLELDTPWCDDDDDDDDDCVVVRFAPDQYAELNFYTAN